uniref:Uncharacterized protein n=1 Tax=Vannella robusta TaxID=1487602 RepID=A0A7S4I5I5_9EUKA|mmetsp:Transcript_20804/g.26310  ORF Transcript_20804/g.26310 Transcript_20804/m.26310 type:complete len:161 (+) Transcript_20804:2-484(+)
MSSTNLKISACEFSGNTAVSVGGGIYAVAFEELNVTDSSFTSNNAEYGASVGVEYSSSADFFSSASVDISSSIFTSNQATDGSIFACLGFADSSISFYFAKDNQKTNNIGNEIDCGVKSLKWLITAVCLTIGAISLIILVACVAFFITKKKDTDEYDIIN